MVLAQLRDGNRKGDMEQPLARTFEPATTESGSPKVKQFRQKLIWPIHLSGNEDYLSTHDHAAAFANLAGGDVWHAVEDEFTGDPNEFQDRHYNEFVTFLPAVQRFLYGQTQGKRSDRTCGSNPVKVMRRDDIAEVCVTLTEGAAPITLKISHIDLHFFYDIDIAILALEASVSDISLSQAQDIMFRLGRAYPAYWQKDGAPGHCPWRVEWRAANGRVLAVSDYEQRAKFLTHVCQNRSARVADHWQFLLRPLLLQSSAEPGPLRYRQLEYYRMPLMALLAFENSHELTRADYVRLALGHGSGSRSELPFTERHLENFENNYCYDRYHERREDSDWPGTRYMSCGTTFVVTGDADNELFLNPQWGPLNSFRHQHFLLFLIAHFHKAALLMFSDRLAEGVNRLDVSDPKTVRAFRIAMKHALETFLRFSHRYWFHSVSNQDQAHDLFALCRRHLDLDQLYDDIRAEVQEMSQFLENEAMRRQNDSITRLTVVTAFGLIGTVATGFLGMNLFDHTALDGTSKLVIFMLVFVPTMFLTFYTIAKSQRLFEFLDAIADEQLTPRDKFRAFRAVWAAPKPKT